jgi:N-acetylmuramoyl-L-alanine amidase
MANKPEWIIIHHSAVSRTKNDKQFKAIDNYHRGKGWGMIGYQYLIEPDGTVMVGRPESKVGAHTYQEGMNYKSIGICLTGHFDLELPTDQQRIQLLELIEELQEKYKIPKEKVVPHRRFAPKSCWGNNLPDDILGYLKAEVQTDLEWCEKHLPEVDWNEMPLESPTAFRAIAMRGNTWWKD